MPVPAVPRERESLVAARGMEHGMTVNRSFKLLVRSRMGKTGESYTAARAALLAGRLPDGPPKVSAAGTAEVPVLATSDQAIRQRTGRGWEEWFELLDQAGMVERPHREIARWVADGLGVGGPGSTDRHPAAVGPVRLDQRRRTRWHPGPRHHPGQGDAASTVTIEHVRLPDQAAATVRKTWWRQQLTTLKTRLESISVGGADHA